MVAALAPLGLDGRLPQPSLTVDSPLEDRLAFVAKTEETLGAVLEEFAQGAPIADGVTTTTTTIAGSGGNDVTVYISRPDNVGGALPCVVHTHGGGMSFLSAADTGYQRWREFLAATGLLVVGVEFRNAGGKLGAHPYPAGLDDCAAAVQWVAGGNQTIGVKRVDEVLEIVGLDAVSRRRPPESSRSGMKQRLGLAGSLLGDPQVLLFDEPVNGLDPEGIYWIRTFMKNLAAQGRTVLVSSHLLSEMALTADHLIVIGRGKLIADSSTADFIARSTRTSVRVRSPQLAELRTALTEAGLAVTDLDGALEVTDAPIEQIGDIAGQAGVTLHELSAQAGSLEEAFIQLTGDSVEYGTSRAGSGPGTRSQPGLSGSRVCAPRAIRLRVCHRLG